MAILISEKDLRQPDLFCFGTQEAIKNQLEGKPYKLVVTGGFKTTRSLYMEIARKLRKSGTVNRVLSLIDGRRIKKEYNYVLKTKPCHYYPLPSYMTPPEGERIIVIPQVNKMEKIGDSNTFWVRIFLPIDIPCFQLCRLSGNLYASGEILRRVIGKRDVEIISNSLVWWIPLQLEEKDGCYDLLK